MRNLLVKTAVLLVALTLTCSAESVLGKKLNFKLPSQFKALSSSVLKAKFPGQNPPKMAYGNENATVTVAINSRKMAVSNKELPEFKDFMKANLQKSRPNIKFQGDSIVTINGQKWAHLVFISQAQDGPIRNEMLMGSKGGTLYMLNLNATTKDYRKYSNALDTLKASLRLR